MKVASLFTVCALSLPALPLVTAAQVPDRGRTGDPESEFSPPVDLWLDQVSYDRGAYIRPRFTTDPGAYVMVLRVTSDGELRMMYPRRPDEQRAWSINQLSSDQVPYSGDPSFRLHESSGNGFVFAIASYQPFDFRAFRHGSYWSTARLAAFGRHEDPFQVVRRFVDRVLPATADFSMDYEIYEVYSRGTRSYYASNFGFWGMSDYENACYSAFGYRYNSLRSRYSNICRPYDRAYYGPIVIGNRPGRRPDDAKEPKIKRVRPRVTDPMIPTEPVDTAQGQQAASTISERAARYEERRRRAGAGADDNGRQAGTSMRAMPREPVIYRSLPQRIEPRSDPAPQRRIEARSEPQAQPRMEGRQAPRPERIRVERPEKQQDKN